MSLVAEARRKLDEMRSRAEAKGARADRVKKVLNEAEQARQAAVAAEVELARAEASEMVREYGAIVTRLASQSAALARLTLTAREHVAVSFAELQAAVAAAGAAFDRIPLAARDGLPLAGDVTPWATILTHDGLDLLAVAARLCPPEPKK